MKKRFPSNVPERFISRKNMIFYVASHSLMPDLRRRLGDFADRIRLIATGTRFEMPLGDEWALYRAMGWKEKLSRKDVQRLAEDCHMVMQFSPSHKMLIPLVGGM